MLKESLVFLKETLNQMSPIHVIERLQKTREPTVLLIVFCILTLTGEISMAQTGVEQCLYDSWISVNDKMLHKVEKELDVCFPKSYREFLFRQNGGSCLYGVSIDPERCRYPPGLKDDYGVLGITCFLSIGLPDEINILDVVESWRIHDGRIPDGMIPIADAINDLILLERNTGKIYLWIREYELHKERDENKYFIAKDFETFLSYLKVDSLRKRRALYQDFDDPEKSICIGDTKGFDNWKQQIDFRSLPYDEKLHWFSDSCVSRNLDTAMAMIDAGLDPVSPDVLKACVEGTRADILISLLESGASLDTLRSTGYVVDEYFEAYEKAWKAGSFRRKTR